MNSKYAIPGLLFLFCFVWIAEINEKNKSKKRIQKETMEVTISATNQIYGNLVDSLGTANCLVPEFYTFLKGMPGEEEKFNRSGLRELSHSARERFEELYKNCILDNIVDTSATLRFNSSFKEQFREKLKDTLLSRFDILPGAPLNRICDCIINQLDNRLTVKEYLVQEYSEKDSTYRILKNCMDSIK